MRIEKPLSKEQAIQGDLMENGDYDFQVLDARERVSKAGNEMLELKLCVWDKKGRERVLYDYLLEALEYKLAHFAECVGLFDKYQDGTLSADECIGKSGQCKVYIQKSKDPAYGDKNSVGDYLLTDAQAAAKTERKQKAAQGAGSDPGFTDDDVPW